MKLLKITKIPIPDEAHPMKLRDTPRRSDTPLRGNKTIIETCGDCGVGIVIPKDRGEYLVYAFRHRFGVSLCEDCFFKWRMQPDWPQPYRQVCPQCEENTHCTCDLWGHFADIGKKV
jgi:hypothetical protein